MLANWIIVLSTILVTVVAALATGFTVSGYGQLAMILGVVGVAMIYFRKEARFMVCLSSLLQISIFSSAFILLTYVGATLDRPLVDNQLAAWDLHMGFHGLTAWHCRLFQWAYDSCLLQTAAIVGILSLSGDAEQLQLFVRRMMIAALLTFAVFLLFPAEGPCATSPSPMQSQYLEHFRSLRDGTRTFFDLSTAEGLVTVPSFHAIWALLLVAACGHRRLIRVPFVLLNAAVIVSTLTTGWHYLVDVLAGVLVCGVVCLATEKEVRVRWKARCNALKWRRNVFSPVAKGIS
jgi:hypothetical protein